MAAHKGTAHHKAKLTEDDVREIRRIRAEEELPYLALADRIGWKVHPSELWRIVHRQAWSHVV